MMHMRVADSLRLGGPAVRNFCFFSAPRRRWGLRVRVWVATLILAHCGVIGSSRANAADVSPRPSRGCELATIGTGERIERTIGVEGLTRSYILHVPARVQPHAPAPLVLDFHGLGHSGAGVWKVSGFRALAERDGVITVYPDGLTVRFVHHDRQFEGAGWEVFTPGSNRDVRFVTALLDRLDEEYCIDRARVYATGFSNGAWLSHLLGCIMSDRLAAIAPVSGGRIPAACHPRRGMPVLIHHGRQDALIDPDDARRARNAWVELNACREHTTGNCDRYGACRDDAIVEYCEGDFAHRWPTEATARIWEFFRAHPLPAPRR